MTTSVIGPILRKYETATFITIPLFADDSTDLDLAKGVTIAAGDIEISKDEGAFASTGVVVAEYGATGVYKMTISDTYINAARIIFKIVDQTEPKAFRDTIVIVETYGNASAQHAFDLDTATQTTDISSSSLTTIAGYVANVATGSLATFNKGVARLLAYLEGQTGSITLKNYETWTYTWSNLSIESTWTKIYLTIKESSGTADANALIQILVSNPADGSDGLQILNKASATASQGSLSLSTGRDQLTATVADDAMQSLKEYSRLYYDVKVLYSDGSSDILENASGTAVITGAITRAIT